MRLVIMTIGIAGTAAIFALLATVTFALNDASTVTAKTLQSFASKQFRTEVSIAEAPTSLKSGITQIINLKVANPTGFSNSTAIDGAAITVQINVQQSTPTKIVLRKITLQRPEVFLEIKDGQANLARIMQAIEAAHSDTSIAGQEFKMIVAEVLLEEGKLSVLIDSLGEVPITTPLPDSRLTNIGVEEDGISPTSFLNQLTAFIIKSTERATRRIDITAIASERGVPAPEIDFKTLLAQ